jgi:hypothetical protein
MCAPLPARALSINSLLPKDLVPLAVDSTSVEARRPHRVRTPMPRQLPAALCLILLCSSH